MSETSRTSLSASPGPRQSTTPIKPQLPHRTAKRKRNDDEDNDHEAVVVNPAKWKKSKKSNKSNSDGDCNLDLDRGLNLAIAKLDNRLLADYVAKRTKRSFPDLSLVELEDRFISGNFLGNKSFRWP
ncbi:MAG: hypothetical protein Q9175_007948 [Cornicularia normoerica]